MKRIRTEPHDHGAEGDERTAVCAPSADPAYDYEARAFIASRVLIDFRTRCWNWTKGVDRQGYGAAYFKSTRWIAHRLSYTAFMGPIPEGLVLDHLCRNPTCVNPWHLEPVTAVENILRGGHSEPDALRPRT